LGAGRDRGEAMTNIIPEMHVLYVHSKAGGLVAYYYHPNRAAVEAKQEEIDNVMGGYVFSIVRYVVASGPPKDTTKDEESKP
jgi:hypothetical protein